MKKIVLTLVITIICLFQGAAQTININGGATGNLLPVNNSEGDYYYSQFIYLGSEINTSGKIKSLTFKLAEAPKNFNQWNNWKIRLAETTEDSYTRGGNFMGYEYTPYNAPFTEVFDGVITNTSNTIKIVLSTPFVYNKSKNLLIEVYEQKSGYEGFLVSTNFKVKSTSGTYRGIGKGASSVRSYSDTSVLDKGSEYVPAIDIEIEAVAPSTGGTTLEYCEGDNLELTAEDAGTGAAYQWTLPNASTVNTKDLTINNLTSAQNGTYKLTVTKDGCSNTTSTEIKVNKLPTLTAPKYKICVGEQLTLTPSGTPATANPFVSSDITVATVTSAGVVKGIKAGTVNITYKNNKGCRVTKQITVNDAPIPTLSNNATANTICKGSSIEFTAGGGAQYEFFVNGSSVQGKSTNNTYATTTLNNNDKVKVKVWNTSGCSAESVETTITVKAAPVITKVEAVSTPLCEGKDAQFLIEGTTDAVVTYTINSGSTKTVTLTGGNATVIINNVTATQTITLSKVTLNGCNVSVNNTTSVTVNPKPKAIIKRI